MSGYKRVNFYELCRLCASNQQKDKTHIFQEQGRKMQLQSKIQQYLSLTVCENDFLPKVVCSQCVHSLEACYIFSRNCRTSETMLSSYFSKFRYTEDFIKSGKVYIKDSKDACAKVAVAETCTPPDLAPPPTQEKHYYTLQVPSVNAQAHPKSHPAPYHLNTINIQAVKSIMGSVAVNSADLLGLTTMEMDGCPPPKPKVTKDDGDLLKMDLINEAERNDKRDAYPLRIPDQNMADQSAAILNTFRMKSGANSSQKIDYLTVLNSKNASIGDAMQSLDSTTQFFDTKTDEKVVEGAQAHAHTLASASGRTHACDVCQKQFKRRELLHQHLKLHMGFRPFRCESCSKAFMRKEHLLRHMTSHSGQKNFTCTVCEKSFSRNDNLLKHRKIHAKQANFVCEVCQKQFVMEHYYVAHKVAHETEEGAGKYMPSPAWSLLKT